MKYLLKLIHAILIIGNTAVVCLAALCVIGTLLLFIFMVLFPALGVAQTPLQQQVAKDLMNTELRPLEMKQQTIKHCKSKENLSELVPKNFIYDGLWLEQDFDEDGRTDYLVKVRSNDSEKLKPRNNVDATLVDRDVQGYILVMNRGKRLEVTSFNYNCFLSEKEESDIDFAPELSIQYNYVDKTLQVGYDNGRYGEWRYEFRYQDGDFVLINFREYETYSSIVETIGSTSIDYEKKVKIRTSLSNENLYDPESEEPFIPEYETDTTSFKLDHLIKMSQMQTIK
ncbi:MAG: hypothetical protein J6Y37_00405 [Paludibacteraceae bacterium]|nr:hypothetical protein [Paludibacteraceae bacterium]